MRSTSSPPADIDQTSFLPEYLVAVGPHDDHTLGGLQNSYRPLADFKRSLAKASSGSFSWILFPQNFFSWKLYPEAIKLAKENNFSVRVRVELNSFDIKNIWWLRQQGIAIEWVDFLENFEVSNSVFYKNFEPGDRVLLVPNKKNKLQIEKFLGTAKNQWLSAMRFYFPFPKKGKSYLKSKEIYNLSEKLTKLFPAITIKIPESYEVWETRIDTDSDLESLVPISLQSPFLANKPKISVIIPTYNNRQHLFVTLTHLSKQTINPQDYEVIVVDDGSTDDTLLIFSDWIKNNFSEISMKYVFFPRKKSRQMGDNLFRAGIARNLGAKHAKGEILCFLDSDIVTPRFFLEELFHSHKTADVVQCVRLDLSEAASSSYTSYEALDPLRHTIAFEGDYWKNFFSCEAWEKLPYFWKYTCTYGLSINKELFKKIGRFKRTFISYGFEDTDLGYRLAKTGAKFHLSRMIVYHLFHQKIRSEFHRSMRKRKQLLERAAQIFYQNNPEGDIYRHFRSFIKDASI